MYLYHYHPITKEYLRKTKAKLDPLESKKRNKKVYLMPQFSTKLVPELKEGMKAVFSENEWVNQIDNRGSKYFFPGDLKEHTILNLGEELPEVSLSEVDPEAVKEDSRKKANSQRKSLRDQIESDFTVKAFGEVWDFSLNSVLKFNGLIALGVPFEWRPKDKDEKKLSIQDAREIGTAVAVKLRKIDRASQKDKKAFDDDNYSLENLKSLVED